ncbi:MAG: lysylphosphatidylglycerol synthase transmembrane domain-containing protein [Chloroflexota bacterium]
MPDTPKTPDPEVQPPALDAQNPSVASPKSMPAFAYASPPSRRTTIVRTIIVVGFFIFVFGILLPHFVNYEEVWNALTSLTAAQLAVAVILGFIAWVLSSGVQAALLPGLGLVHSTESFLAGQAVSNTIPGPVDLAIRYILYRQWGHAPEPSSMSIVLAGVFDQLAALSLPLFAVVLLALSGTVNGTLVAVALLGAAVIVVIFGLGIWILRSESFTRQVARLSERILRAVFHFIRRPTPTGIPERTLAVRASVKDLLLTRGGLAYIADLSGRVFYGLVFVVCLRETGVPESAVSLAQVMAVYAAVGICLILPIAPGGAGTPQVLYIAWLSNIAPNYSTQISAGVFLFFTVQWVMPTVLGWIVLGILRRGRPLLSMAPEPVPAPEAVAA